MMDRWDSNIIALFVGLIIASMVITIAGYGAIRSRDQLHQERLACIKAGNPTKTCFAGGSN